ncbi:MAG: type II toxin-antitoxin system HicA family toxin [Armatimonadetes bacterium]|nr:type II toxin-antitoxin system HicA family toxin [Akkermansiaceae bacterium]
MKLPRDVAAGDIIVALRVLGYEPARQAGSHIRLTTTLGGSHHVTIPNHPPLKTGTLLGGILSRWQPTTSSPLRICFQCWTCDLSK